MSNEKPGGDGMLDAVERAVRGVRGALVDSEYELHGRIARELEAAGIAFEREVKLGERMRIDFLCQGGVGIEVKKGKVGSAALAGQAWRYAGSDRVTALVLVVERNVAHVPATANGKPVRYIGLSKLWGVAI
jgi:hypothetical protein